MSESTAMVRGPRNASDILAEHLALDPKYMISVIKSNCFGGVDPSKVSNEQLAAYVNVANDLARRAPGFNPLLPGMLYAYPKQGGGIQPMLGPDGVFALLSQRPDYDGLSTEVITDERGALKAVRADIFVKGRERPCSYTALLSEWSMASNPNWKSRPQHMLTIRAIKQAARQLIHGIPLDADEVRIIEAEAGTYSSRVVAPKTDPRTAQVLAAMDEPASIARDEAAAHAHAPEHEEHHDELFAEEDQ